MATPKELLAERYATHRKKDWIQNAVQHPGALHDMLGVPKGKKIPAKKLHAAAKKGGLLGKRARLAETLEHMNG